MVAFAAHLHARAADTIIMLQLFEKFRQVFWIVLQIRVHGEKILASRRLQSSETRRALTAIEFKFLHPDARVFCREFLEDLPRPVLTAVIRNNHLIGNLQRINRQSDGLDQFTEIAFLVITRDDEADFRIFKTHRKKCLNHDSTNFIIRRKEIFDGGNFKNAPYSYGIKLSLFAGRFWKMMSSK